jgi:hypothetical protein
MALSRKKALERMLGLERTVRYHLDRHIPETIEEDPTAVSHWRKEVGAFLDEMERLASSTGRKTAAVWREKTRRMRDRLYDLLGEEQ